MNPTVFKSTVGIPPAIRVCKEVVRWAVTLSSVWGLVGVGCAGAGIPGRLTVDLHSPGDDAIVQGSNRQVKVVITSPRGIGSASIISPDAQWPRRMVIGLRYSSDRPFLRLESCRVTTGESSWHTALGRADTSQAFGGTRDTRPDGGSIAVPVHGDDGMMAVHLPDTLLAVASDTIVVSWVDVFRN